MKGKSLFTLLLFFLFSLFNFAFAAQQSESWPNFIKSVRNEAMAQGIRPETFDQAFRNIHAPNRKVLSLDRSQPEHRLTYLKYRTTRADKYRIIIGRKMYERHKALLTEIGDKFGVSPCFITSLWGLETSYGNFMGNFPVIQSLATLAYNNNRRADFFRKQLLLALHILNDGHVSLQDFKGEWAGASGQPQFLPSSWHAYAVDYDGDGRKDIWKTYPDIFASIANYLVKNGWQKGQPWMIPVSAPNLDEKIMTREVTKTVSEWAAMGVKPLQGSFPDGNLRASIVHPDGGPTMMVFNNFNVIMKWNRSIYYAGTVGYLAEQICKHPL